MPEKLRILALNVWHGGSHRAFLDGWIRHSRHDFTVLSLPPSVWKWRMRHAAVTFGREVAELDHEFDVLFCTDMLNLAEFKGLCPPHIRELPTVVYFHENQLTYPVQQAEERDLHFAYSNFTTALSADAVWFNSDFHRREFLDALGPFLKRMPDHSHADAVEFIAQKSSVQSPGIAPGERRERRSGPIRLLWASRWEHDKNPELFFASVKELRSSGCCFRLNVLGESFRNSPVCFAEARDELDEHIDHWGYAESRADYLQVLADSDIVVSTASHEFFGIAVVEAVAAGCIPVVPHALAYPETLGNTAYFHDSTESGVVNAIRAANTSPPILPDVSRYHWTQRAAEMDLAITHGRGPTNSKPE